MDRILIAGCGRLGVAMAELPGAERRQLFGLRRNPESLPESIEGVAGDLRDPSSLRSLPEVDALAFLPSPGQMTEEDYRATYLDGLANLLAAPFARGLSRLLVVSSTAVYGQDDGSWVDETSPCEPENYRGRVMLEAERLALTRGPAATVVRFTGIYGPSAGALVERVRRGGSCRGCYTNRIHVRDAAAVMLHLLDSAPGHDVVIGTDDAPSLDCEVMEWLATRLDAPAPRRERGVANAGKRCSNGRLRRMGFEFRYPDYRAGYDAILSGAHA